jgi:hypothetical protein
MTRNLDISTLKSAINESGLLRSIISFDKAPSHHVIESTPSGSWLLYIVDDRGGEFNRCSFNSEGEAVYKLLSDIITSYENDKRFIKDINLIRSIIDASSF